MTFLETLYSYYDYSPFVVILFALIAVTLVAVGARVTNIGAEAYYSNIPAFIVYCIAALVALTFPLLFTFYIDVLLPYIESFFRQAA